MALKRSTGDLAGQLKKLELQVKKLENRLDKGNVLVAGTIRRTCIAAGNKDPIKPGDPVVIKPPKGERAK